MYFVSKRRLAAKRDERRGKEEAKLGRKVFGTSFAGHFAARDRAEKFYLTIDQLCVSRLLRPSLSLSPRDRQRFIWTW